MSLLQEIEDAQVVSIELSDDKKTMELIECCDMYYKVDLTKAEVRSLLIELDFMYNLMKD